METEVLVTLITGGVAILNLILTGAMNYFTKKSTQKSVEQSEYQEKVQEKLSEYDERISNLENGVQSLLRLEIIRSHDKYMERQFCPVYAKESLSRAYRAYHALGGNDVATELYHETIELPTESTHD